MEKRGSGGASFTDFTEVSGMGVSLSSVFLLLFSLCVAFLPYRLLPNFFTACHLFPNATMLSE